VIVVPSPEGVSFSTCWERNVGMRLQNDGDEDETEWGVVLRFYGVEQRNNLPRSDGRGQRTIIKKSIDNKKNGKKWKTEKSTTRDAWMLFVVLLFKLSILICEYLVFVLEVNGT